MCKFKSLLLTVALFSLAGTYVHGQRNEITEKEYGDLVKRTGEKTRALTYRLINEKTIYDQDGITIRQREKNLTESVPPGRLRFLNEVVNLVSNKSFLTEIIRIDGVEYRRRDQGNWEIVNSITRIGGKNIEPENKYKKYYLTKNVCLDGQFVDILEFDEEFVSKVNDPKTGRISETAIYQNQKWISAGGVWISFEMVNERVNPRSIIVRSIWNYEYDPNIAIAVPATNEKERQ